MTASRLAQHLLLASIALFLFAADLARAQQPQQQQPSAVRRQQQVLDPNTTVLDRKRPEYEALGMRAGAFFLYPELAVIETYTDNVAFDEDDEKSDFVTQIQPSVELRSDWSRHALGFQVGGDIAIHAEENDEDYQDLFALGDARIDVTRQTDIRPTVEVRRAHEGRDDPEDPGNDQLLDYYQYGGGLALRHAFNRVTVTLSGEALRSSYDDDEEEDRNDWVYDTLLRTAYEVSPRLDLFAEGRYNVEDRDDNVDDNGIERDTNGYEGRIGAGLDVTSLLFGEAFVGYRVQEFADDDFDDETGVSFGLDLNWNPTQLTSIGLTGQRDFRPTDEAGAASNFRTELGVTIDHELLRNLILGGRARYLNDDFRGGDDRKDDTYLLGAGLTYWLNRNLSVKAGYDYSQRESNADGQDFKVNEIFLGLTARL